MTLRAFDRYLKEGLIIFFRQHIVKLKKKYNFALAQKMSVRRDHIMVSITGCLSSVGRAID